MVLKQYKVFLKNKNGHEWTTIQDSAYPPFEAMSARSSKRLRSLASTLWGDSDDEDMGSHLCPMCRKPSGVFADLRAQIQNLEAQKSSFQNEIFELRKKLARVTLQLFEVQKFVVPLGGQAGPHRTPISEDSWLEDNPHLLDLPRMPQFLKELQTFDHKSEIFFRLCSQNATTASRILQHCEWVVHSLSKKIQLCTKLGSLKTYYHVGVGKHTATSLISLNPGRA